MSQLQELLAQRAALEAQIAAEKPNAVAQVREVMAALGVTVDDLVGPQRAGASKRPVKYRDAKGNTWTGVGQRPRWLRDAMLAGAALSDFGVGKP